jgi:Family of unknown function (DUF6152)
MKTILNIVLLAWVLSTGHAWAHHSFAMFDSNKDVDIVGVVKDFQWTNPHMWIQIDVSDAKGVPVEWSIEGGSPNVLARQGWKSTSVKPGDKVTITIHPLKNGEAGGSLVKVKLPDGKVIGNQGTALPPVTPAPDAKS